MPKPIPFPKAVFFDLDDTLYEYEPAHRAALRAVRSKAHVQLGVGTDDFDQLFERARKETKERLRNTASSHSRLLYFQRLIELIGLKTQALLALDFEQAYWRTFLGAASLFPGVRELLDDLHTLGVPRVLVTDLTTQIQLRKLVYFRLDGQFDVVVSSEEAGVEKPAAAVFHLGLAKSGVETGPFWMIGDSLEKDIEGAKAALGAYTFWRTKPALRPRATPPGVDLCFDSFEQLRRVLQLSASGAEPAVAVGERSLVNRW